MVVGHRRPPDRHPGPPQAVRDRPVRAGSGRRRGASPAPRWPVCRRSTGFVAKESVYGALIDVARHGEGTGLGGSVGWARADRRGARLGAHRGLHGSVPVGGLRHQARVQSAPSSGGSRPGSWPYPCCSACRRSCWASWVGPRPRCSRRTQTCSRSPSQDAGLALWHGPESRSGADHGLLGAGLLLFWATGSFADLQYRPQPAVERRTWLLPADAAAGPRCRRGHRPHPARIGGDLPERDPGGRRAASRVGPGRREPTARVDVVRWDNAGQVVVAAIVVVAAVLTTRSRRRLKAVVMVGVTGYGTAMLFLLHGAPDLALTQVLVETVTLVVFVLVLRRLPEYFTDRPLTRSPLLEDGDRGRGGGGGRRDHGDLYRRPHRAHRSRRPSPGRRWRSAGAGTSST